MILRNVLIYGMSEAVNRGLAFLLLPIFSHYLSTSEFGMLSGFYAVTEVAIYLCGLNLNATIRPLYIKEAASRFAEYLGSGIVAVAVSTAGLTLIGAFLSRFIDLGVPIEIVLAATLSPGLQSITLAYLSLQQIRERPYVYLSFTLAYSAINVGLSLLFLIVVWKGWHGRVYALLVTNMAFGALAAILKSPAEQDSAARRPSRSRDRAPQSCPIA